MFLFDNGYMEEDLSLVSRVKNGDDEAFTMLLQTYSRMIYKIINSFNLNIGDFSLDTDSLFQEGSLGLYFAVQTYEDNRGMKFSTYAYMVIKSKINNEYHKYMRRYRSVNCSIDAFKNPDYLAFLNKTSISDNPLEYQEYLRFTQNINTFISKLSNEDKQIFNLRLEDLSYKQIAERLSINTKRVDNRLRTLRIRLRKQIDK